MLFKDTIVTMEDVADFQIRPARVEDVPIILQLIRDLATYERAPDEVSSDRRTACRCFVRRTARGGSAARF